MLDFGAAPVDSLSRAPCVLIDECGDEVGVVLDYRQYVGLLGLVAASLDPALLSPYWQHALESFVEIVPSPAVA